MPEINIPYSIKSNINLILDQKPLFEVNYCRILFINSSRATRVSWMKVRINI